MVVVHEPGVAWLPITDFDPGFDHFLHSALVEVEGIPGYWLRILFQYSLVSTHHGGVLLLQGHQAEVVQLFTDKPVSAVQWLVRVNLLPAALFVRIGTWSKSSSDEL